MHERARADPPSRVARAGHARERRRLEPPERPRAGHRDDGRGEPLRRPARVDAERVGRPAARRAGRGAHSRRARRGADRHPSGPGRRGRADGLQVARPRRRGPRRRRADRRARPASRASAPRSSSDPVRGDRARARDDRRRRDPHAAPAPRTSTGRRRSGSSSRTSSRSARSRSAAPSTRSGRRLTSRPRKGVVTASAGNMAQGVAWAARELGVPATVIAPEHRAADEARRDRAARRHGRQGAVRALVGDHARPRSSTKPRASSSIRCRTSA